MGKWFPVWDTHNVMAMLSLWVVFFTSDTCIHVYIHTYLHNIINSSLYSAFHEPYDMV